MRIYKNKTDNTIKDNNRNGYFFRKFSIFNSQLSIPLGFTLIELLVVILIIGILAVGTISLINPKEQIQKGLDARRKADLAQVQRALELYYHDNNQYPTSGTIVWGGTWQPYMGSVPDDPVSSKQYVYISTGQAYYLYASLDRASTDAQACNGGSACTNAGGANCGGVCNYGVSSPNVTP
jgi:general secretion pathway protein G